MWPLLPVVRRRIRGWLQAGVRALVFGAGATLGLAQAYAVPVGPNRGPAGSWWEPLRRRASVWLGNVFDEQSGPRPITAGEYAGSLDRSVPETEALLWAHGFIRNPFARLKTRDGTPEAGSWVIRERPLAPRQVHVMLFPAQNGGTDVYAHEEPSSVHPCLATEHVDGDGQRLAAGVEYARGLLPLDTADAPVDPPEGPWTESEPATRPGEDGGDLSGLPSNHGTMTGTASGWQIVAAEDEAATIIASILELDTEGEYTRSELASAADIPLKTLYLLDTLDQLKSAGMLERVDDIDAESEPCFVIDTDSALYEAAEQFDETFAAQLDGQ
jgi:hypothetical protein